MGQLALRGQLTQGAIIREIFPTTDGKIQTTWCWRSSITSAYYLVIVGVGGLWYHEHNTQTEGQ